MSARSLRSGLPLGSLLAASVAFFVLPLGVPSPLLAQAAKEAPKLPGDAPKQITLTQAKIDGLVAAQKKIQEVESKAQSKGASPDQVDAKTQKEVEGVITSSGFATMKDFADTMFSVGIVLSGIDPEGDNYIGTAAALQKESDQIKADKKMPPKEKKEALDEIEASIKSASAEKPLPGNVDVVKANMSKLEQGQKAD